MKKKTAAHIRLGREGERLARRFLEFTLGYELIEHNLKLHSAEIDLLMRDGKTFVLVEVKSTRWRGEEYHPGLHYTTEQQIRQRRAVHELERKFGTRESPSGMTSWKSFSDVISPSAFIMFPITSTGECFKAPELFVSNRF